jgi:hypothetical protein
MEKLKDYIKRLEKKCLCNNDFKFEFNLNRMDFKPIKNFFKQNFKKIIMYKKLN